MDLVSCLSACTDLSCQKMYTERAQTRLVSEYPECSSSSRVSCWRAALSPAGSGHSCPPCLLSRWDQALLIQAVPKSMEQRINSIWSMPHPQAWHLLSSVYSPGFIPNSSIYHYSCLNYGGCYSLYQKHFLLGNWSKASKEWKEKQKSSTTENAIDFIQIRKCP